MTKAQTKIQDLVNCTKSKTKIKLPTKNTDTHVLLQDALGIELAAEPTSSSSMATMFLVDSKVLYQLSCFGMNDTEQVVMLFIYDFVYFVYL